MTNGRKWTEGPGREREREKRDREREGKGIERFKWTKDPVKEGFMKLKKAKLIVKSGIWHNSHY